MVTIKPLEAYRPNSDMAREVASLPYDVCSVSEARAYTDQPHHYYHITRAEIDLPSSVDVHDAQVYEQAHINLEKFIADGVLNLDDTEGYYIYKLVMNGRAQTGLLCLSSVSDYNAGLIKKHEFTRPEKEQDRIDHMLATKAQTGVVFLAYRDVQNMNDFVKDVQSTAPLFDFTSEDGVQHTIWLVNTPGQVDYITNTFKNQVPATYIADGHHRAATASKVAAQLADNPKAQFFLTCIFPQSELKILDYNRVVKDLNGMSATAFVEALQDDFEVEKVGNEAYRPSQFGEFGMYIDGVWYKLNAKSGTYDAEDPIKSLDVQILQDNVLSKLLAIHDPRVDDRVEFVGGIRGLGELEKRVNSGDCVAAFSCYPVSLDQLFKVADSGQVMPPKSTWFEPKTRDGLVTYKFG